MNPTLRLVIFFSILAAVAVGSHVYFYRRLVRDIALPPRWRRLASIALLALLLILLAGLLAGRALPHHLRRVVMFPIYVWLGIMFYTLLLLALADILHGGRRLLERLRGTSPTNLQRRIFLSRVAAGVALGGSAAITATASRDAMATSRLTVKKVEISLARLPAALDGFRIVQLSDLHIGATLGRAWLEAVMAKTQALHPDVVAITGDIVDGSVPLLRDELAPLTHLRVAGGIYVCTGNHEYYSGAIAWCNEFERMGLHVLRNERVAIGHGDATFDLAGIDDYSARFWAVPGHGADLGHALAGRDPARELVLLAHQPKQIYQAAHAGVGLQLSGHTHGGQLWPWLYLVRLQQPYISGLATHPGGPTQIYVSEGTGFWGPPLRLGTHAEITDITLRARSHAK